MIQLFNFLVALDTSSSGDAPLNENDFINKLIPNWTSFVTQIIALVFVIIIVILIGYKPVKKMLKKRQDFVENNIQQAEVNRLQAERDAKQASEMIIASKKQASEIIQNAEEDANKRREEILLQTDKDVTKMKLDAEKDIEKSREEAKQQIHDEIVSVALSATSEVLKREINEKDNARIVDDFIKDMDK